jgi:hypothetical protein
LRVESSCSLACQREIPAHPLRELPVVASGCARQLECLLAVVDEDLCVVLGAFAGDSLDPCGCRTVLLRARRAWDLLIGDVADEHVPEGEFLLPFDG